MPTPALIGGFDPFGEDRNCSDFTDWATAQAFFAAAGGPSDDPHQLDGDNDAIACESLPGAP
jgi:micrococcal nuclease